MEDRYARLRPSSDQDGKLNGTHWSARAQRLLEASYASFVDGLREPVRRCLAGFEEQLFQLADRAHNSTVQQDCFASRQRVLQNGNAFTKRFMTELGTAFDQIGQDKSASEAAASTNILWQSLELVDPSEQEVSMSIEHLGSRGEVRHSNVLGELSYRLGVLVGAPPLEGPSLPIGPHALAMACSVASSGFELPHTHKLLLLRQFDQWIIQAAGPLYGAINDQLKADGVMPKLRSASTPRHSGQRARSTNLDSDDAGDTKTAAPTAAEAGASKDARPAEAAADAPMAVLESLRDLLAQQRTAQGRGTGVFAGRAASENELQSALGALQQHLAQVTDRASRELHSAARLRDELLAQLNFGKPAGVPRTQLSDEQGDTVELVARLFEQLGAQLQHGGNASTLLTDLQLPVLRMAVADHSFFDEHDHPARRLLDTVTAAANEWIDGSDDESSRPLALKLEQLVSRANHEPPSAGLYTTLLADIEHHLALLTRKAQAAERRHVEAAQGRERLDQARLRAGELMAERFAESPPHGLLRALLDRAWSDVLALTLLRHGEDSDTFRAQLKITDQLLGRLPLGDRLHLQAEVESGLQQIGMRTEEAVQVAQRLLGITAPDPSVEVPSATDLAIFLKQHQRFGTQQPNRTTAPKAPATVPPSVLVVAPPIVVVATPPPRDVATRKNRAAPAPVRAPAAAAGAARVAVPVPVSVPAHVPVAAPAPSTATAAPQRASAAIDSHVRRIEQRLKQSPFGSWFEFTDPATGHIARRKLAWYSPMSGRCLMVSRRGQPGEEMTLVQLAHDVASGRAREASIPPGSMLDRAWRSLTGSLQTHRASTRGSSSP
ncbi:MAG: DUF1631 family protein [Rhodanobacter sp.]